MFKKLHAPLSGYLLALLLASCGGGGGGGSSNTPESNSGPSSPSAGIGVLSLYAGSLGGDGYSDGPGSGARFDRLHAITTDSSGNLYLADHYTSTIRKVTSAGVVTTIAGAGYMADHVDGLGINARFNRPDGIAYRAGGTIYVADSGDHTIRRIAGGTVTTFAGTNGVSGNSDGPGTSASFNEPSGLALDSAGNLYVADTANYLIRKITAAGVVTTLAGAAGMSGNVDATGSAARFSYPRAVAIDGANNVYVADSYGVRKIDPVGAVTTPVSGGTLASAGCSSIAGVSADAANNLYVTSGYDVCKVSASGIVTHVAGSGFSGTATGPVDGIASAARFASSMALAVNSAGDTLYVADLNAVRKVILATASVTTLAGKSPDYGFANGSAASAKFFLPQGIAADSAGNLFFADAMNYVVRKISAGNVQDFAGLAQNYGTVDGTGSAARFNFPGAVAADNVGNVYVVDSTVIRKITPGRIVTTLAGSVTGGFANGTGSAAQFSYPAGLVADAAGNIYVADSGNNCIRKINPGGVVTTFVGTPGISGYADGSGASALFSYPADIKIDSSGNLYVADEDNNAVRKITPSGTVTTVAGGPGKFGYADGLASIALFGSPRTLAIDAANNLYIAEYWNGTIRKITPTGVVSTVVGSADGRFVVTPGSPGHLNAPWGMTVIGKKLYLTDENSILVVDLP